MSSSKNSCIAVFIHCHTIFKHNKLMVKLSKVVCIMIDCSLIQTPFISLVVLVCCFVVFVCLCICRPVVSVGVCVYVCVFFGGGMN